MGREGERKEGDALCEVASGREMSGVHSVCHQHARPGDVPCGVKYFHHQDTADWLLVVTAADWGYHYSRRLRRTVKNREQKVALEGIAHCSQLMV